MYPKKFSFTSIETTHNIDGILYVLTELFRVNAACIPSFQIRSRETLRIKYPKYLVLNMIQRIHLRCGSFGSIIRFWVLVKKRNIHFRNKNPDLVYSKETHP